MPTGAPGHGTKSTCVTRIKAHRTFKLQVAYDTDFSQPTAPWYELLSLGAYGSVGAEAYCDTHDVLATDPRSPRLTQPNTDMTLTGQAGTHLASHLASPRRYVRREETLHQTDK